MLGIYYMIRHKASGEFMPQMKRGRGYSHWNPSNGELPKKITGCPRLLPSRKSASRVIIQWNSMPNARYSSYQSHGGDWDYGIDIKNDGRKKEDLEIVEVNIEEVKL